MEAPANSATRTNPVVVIIDYGMGNLFSIERAIKHVGGVPVISAEPSVITSAERLILPGVGAFGKGIENLTERGLVGPIKEAVASGKTLLGICLGMQLLMTEGEEFGVHAGLDMVKGMVRRFTEPNSDGPYFKIPHVGWDKLNLPASSKGNPWEGTIFNGLREEVFVYFVHSYIVVPDSPSDILAETVYGNDRFCSALRQDNLYGCQFHPELSGEVGLQIIRDFLFNL